MSKEYVLAVVCIFLLCISADYFSGNSIYLIIQLFIQYSPFAGRQPNTLSLSGIFSDIEYLS